MSPFFWGCLYHGARGSFVAACTSVVAYKGWPDSWAWMIIGAGAVIGFFNGVDAYRTGPK